MRRLKKRLQTMNLQTILFLFITMMLTASILGSGFFAYRIFERNMVDQLANARIDVLAQVSGRLDTLNRVMVSYSDLFYYSDLFSEEPLSTPLTETAWAAFAQKLDLLNKDYSKALITNGEELSYIVCTEDGHFYHSQRKSEAQDVAHFETLLWKYNFGTVSDDLHATPAYTDSWGGSSAINMISLMRRITPPDANMLGWFLVNAKEPAVRSTFEKSLNQNNSIYIVSGDGQIISHRDPEMVGIYFYRMDRLNEIFQGKDYSIVKKGGEDYLFSRFYNERFGWTAFEEIPMDIVLQRISGVRTLLSALYVFMLLVCGLAAYKISKWLAFPLHELCVKLKLVAAGNDTVYFDLDGYREVLEISGECLKMNQRITQLIKNVRDREAQIRKAELDFLYLQINPHFIHNTLFSLKCLISLGKNQAAEDMLTEFSSLISNIFRSQEALIPITHELDIAEKYMRVQKYRYGDKFTMEVRCAQGLGHCKIPKLVLQPILENAIFHGIEPSSQYGRIVIEIIREEQDIVLSIEDNGVGFLAAEKLLDADSGSDSIGIRNVNNRIQLMFGEPYRLTIKSVPLVGTTVRIRLPLIEESEEWHGSFGG